MSKKIVLAPAGMRWAMTAGQMKAVKLLQAIVDLIARGHEVIVTMATGHRWA